MDKTNSKSNSVPHPKRRVSRRNVLKGAAALTAAGFTWKSIGPFVRDAEAATLELRWLGWEHYNVKSLTAEFENRHDVKVSAGVLRRQLRSLEQATRRRHPGISTW